MNPFRMLVFLLDIASSRGHSEAVQKFDCARKSQGSKDPFFALRTEV